MIEMLKMIIREVSLRNLFLPTGPTSDPHGYHKDHGSCASTDKNDDVNRNFSSVRFSGNNEFCAKFTLMSG